MVIVKDKHLYNYQIMKKSIFIFIFFFASLLLAEQEAKAQQSIPQPYARSTAQIADRYPHIVKVNVLSPFVLTANGAYEQFINPKLSLQLGAYYNGITIRDDFLWFSLPYARYRSFAITPEFRFYTGSAARPKLNGLYLAPFMRYQNTSIKTTLKQQDSQGNPQNYEGSLSSVRLGAVAGYKFILGQRVSLEIFTGPSLRITNWLKSNINTYSAEDFLPFGFTIRSGITLGYVF